MKNFFLILRIKTSILLVCFMGIFNTPINAQQTLNFDFEILSIEGIHRPWGWEFDSNSETQVTLDSVVKHHGKYSLKVKDKGNTGKLIFSHFLEPFELVNNTVTVEGWIKTETVKGKAKFVVSITTRTDTSVIKLESEPVSNSRDWIKLMIKKQMPDSINSISLSLQYEGTGTVWFDDFKLTVNDTYKKALELIHAFNKSQLNWIGDHSYPIRTEDPLQIGNEDLLAFKSLLSDAIIIALGESTHGTSEFFKLKHRILEYCVKELGVRVFAIEDHQLVVNRVNNYVLGGKGSARSSMYGMLGVWQTQEVHDLIEWIRTYNDLHPDGKVEFMGFDIQNHLLPIDSLYSFINKQSPNLAKSIEDLLNDLKINGANSYSVSESVKLKWYTNSQKAFDLISEHSEKWLVDAKNRSDSLSVIWGLQYANLVKQFAENTYRGHESLYRDIAMAENLSWIQNTYKPNSKILVWAHDVHISRGEHPNREHNIYYGKSMGAYLSKEYERKYKSFGLSTYEGEYSCYVSYTNYNITDCPLYVAPRGTLDEALHTIALQSKSPMLFLNMNGARSLDWFTQPIPVRFANHVNIEYGYWTRYSVPYQFDGIFFIDKTTSAKSYARQ